MNKIDFVFQRPVFVIMRPRQRALGENSDGMRQLLTHFPVAVVSMDQQTFQ